MSLYNCPESSGYLANIAKKSLVLNRTNFDQNKDLKQKENYLFNDPNTYLKLPNETNFKYMVGKNPKGPQLDMDDKIIPYTLVGPPKFFRNKQKEYFNNSKSSKMSFCSRVNNTKISNNKNNNNNNYNLLNDEQIKEIFSRFKNVMNENNNMNHRKKLMTQIDCPKVMDQFIRDPLELQEKTLKKNMEYNNSIKTIEESIQRKMFLKMKNKPKSFSNTYNNSSNSSKDINFNNLSDLVMNSGDEYRLKNEIKNDIEKNKYEKFVLPNVNQNWQMSLRRPQNFTGTRNEYLNIGSSNNYPVWCIATEKNPDYSERILNPKKDINLSTFADKTSSLDKVSNNNKKNYTTTDNSLKNNIRRNNTSDFLEIQGTKLIDFEEDNYKKLKGKKKKLLNFKYDAESTKDIVFCKDYSINNNHYEEKEKKEKKVKNSKNNNN